MPKLLTAINIWKNCLFIAKKGGYEKHRKAYLALIALRDALGHTPKGAEQVRSDLDKDLRKYISKDYDNWEGSFGEIFNEEIRIKTNNP